MAGVDERILSLHCLFGHSSAIEKQERSLPASSGERRQAFQNACMDGGVDIVEHRQPELLAMALGDVAVLVLVCLHVTEDPGDVASGLGILSGKEGNASAKGRDVTFGTVVLGWGPVVLLQKSLQLSRGMSFF